MSTIKTDRIEPLGTTIVVSSGITVGGGAHFSGGVTAAGGISAGSNSHFGGNVRVTGGLTADSFVSVGSAILSAPSGSAPMFVCRAYCTVVAASASSISSQVGQNLTATNPAAGRYDFTFTTNMSNENYAVVISNSADFSNRVLVGNAHSNSNGTSITPTASGFSVGFQTTGGVAQNPRFFSVAVFA